MNSTRRLHLQRAAGYGRRRLACRGVRRRLVRSAWAAAGNSVRCRRLGGWGRSGARWRSSVRASWDALAAGGALVTWSGRGSRGRPGGGGVASGQPVALRCRHGHQGRGAGVLPAYGGRARSSELLLGAGCPGGVRGGALELEGRGGAGVLPAYGGRARSSGLLQWAGRGCPGGGRGSDGVRGGPLEPECRGDAAISDSGPNHCLTRATWHRRGGGAGPATRGRRRPAGATSPD